MLPAMHSQTLNFVINLLQTINGGSDVVNEAPKDPKQPTLDSWIKRNSGESRRTVASFSVAQPRASTSPSSDSSILHKNTLSDNSICHPNQNEEEISKKASSESHVSSDFLRDDKLLNCASKLSSNLIASSLLEGDKSNISLSTCTKNVAHCQPRSEIQEKPVTPENLFNSESYASRNGDSTTDNTSVSSEMSCKQREKNEKRSLYSQSPILETLLSKEHGNLQETNSLGMASSMFVMKDNSCDTELNTDPHASLSNIQHSTSIEENELESENINLVSRLTQAKTVKFGKSFKLAVKKKKVYKPCDLRPLLRSQAKKNTVATESTVIVTPGEDVHSSEYQDILTSSENCMKESLAFNHEETGNIERNSKITESSTNTALESLASISKSSLKGKAHEIAKSKPKVPINNRKSKERQAGDFEIDSNVLLVPELESEGNVDSNVDKRNLCSVSRVQTKVSQKENVIVKQCKSADDVEKVKRCEKKGSKRKRSVSPQKGKSFEEDPLQDSSLKSRNKRMKKDTSEKNNVAISDTPIESKKVSSSNSQTHNNSNLNHKLAKEKIVGDLLEAPKNSRQIKKIVVAEKICNKKANGCGNKINRHFKLKRNNDLSAVKTGKDVNMGKSGMASVNHGQITTEEKSSSFSHEKETLSNRETTKRYKKKVTINDNQSNQIDTGVKVTSPNVHAEDSETVNCTTADSKLTDGKKASKRSKDSPMTKRSGDEEETLKKDGDKERSNDEESALPKKRKYKKKQSQKVEDSSIISSNKKLAQNSESKTDVPSSQNPTSNSQVENIIDTVVKNRCTQKDKKLKSKVTDKSSPSQSIENTSSELDCDTKPIEDISTKPPIDAQLNRPSPKRKKKTITESVKGKQMADEGVVNSIPLKSGSSENIDLDETKKNRRTKCVQKTSVIELPTAEPKLLEKTQKLNSSPNKNVFSDSVCVSPPSSDGIKSSTVESPENNHYYLRTRAGVKQLKSPEMHAKSPEATTCDTDGREDNVAFISSIKSKLADITSRPDVREVIEFARTSNSSCRWAFVTPHLSPKGDIVGPSLYLLRSRKAD